MVSFCCAFRNLITQTHTLSDARPHSACFYLHLLVLLLLLFANFFSRWLFSTLTANFQRMSFGLFSVFLCIANAKTVRFFCKMFKISIFFFRLFVRSTPLVYLSRTTNCSLHSFSMVNIICIFIPWAMSHKLREAKKPVSIIVVYAI